MCVPADCAGNNYYQLRKKVDRESLFAFKKVQVRKASRMKIFAANSDNHKLAEKDSKKFVSAFEQQLARYFFGKTA